MFLYYPTIFNRIVGFHKHIRFRREKRCFMKRNHLRLVINNNGKKNFIQKFIDWLNEPRYFEIKIPFIKTKEEKIQELRKFYTMRFRAEDLRTEGVNVPYFLRVEQLIKEITSKDTVNKVYKETFHGKKIVMRYI